ncbi:MAG: hypothetical protein H0U49_00195 [Parachlamydiaceae bacterium]|nr:hypothetical protein [Parachlamydiaceae bacterium]
MVLKALLAITLSLLLPLTNLQGQIPRSDSPPESPYMQTEYGCCGIAYERGIGTSKLVATFVIGSIGVAIVAIALFNTNYCAGHTHHNHCDNNQNHSHKKHSHSHNCH